MNSIIYFTDYLIFIRIVKKNYLSKIKLCGMMNELENIVLDLLIQGYSTYNLEKKLDLKDEDLAEIIINLEEKGLVILKDKKWRITEKGKGESEKRRAEKLKKIKIDFFHGEIDKDEYHKKKKELTYISQITSDQADEMTKLPEKIIAPVKKTEKTLKKDETLEKFDNTISWIRYISCKNIEGEKNEPAGQIERVKKDFSANINKPVKNLYKDGEKDSLLDRDWQIIRSQILSLDEPLEKKRATRKIL